MTTLNDSDLFLMQRDDLVLSFNGLDFKEIVVEAGKDGLSDLTDKIDLIDDHLTGVEQRVEVNENTIDILTEAVNTLQKTSSKAKLVSSPLSEPVGEGQFQMTDAAGVDTLVIASAKTLFISATTSDWGNSEQTPEVIYDWINLRLQGLDAEGNTDENEIGDYIQVFNASGSGYGLFSLVTKETLSVDGNDIAYKFGVEFVKGDGGEVTHYNVTNPEEAHVVILGIKTKVGLDIDNADDRYLVKAEGGVVVGPTEFLKKVTIGADLTHSAHTNNTFDEDSISDALIVNCKDTDGVAKRKFKVKSNGELIASEDFKPSADLHLSTVKYVRSSYLTEDGADGTISANFKYLRLDGSTKMKNCITFANGNVNGDIVKLESIIGGTAKINTTNNNLNITTSYDNSFTIGLMDYNTFTWYKGKATASDTHQTFCMNNYENPSNDHYLATLGSVNKAIKEYPMPERGTNGRYGLVKLSDTIDSVENGDTGVACSRKAVHDVNIKIYRGMPVVKDSATAKSQAAGGFRYSNGNLYYRVN